MELKTFFAQDLMGNVIANPIATVYLADGETLALGLETAAGVELSNPFNGTTEGKISFAAPDGDYILRVVGGGRVIDLPLRFIDSDDLLLRVAGIDAPGVIPHVRRGSLWTPLPYLVPFGFGSIGEEPLLLHVFSERVTFPANFAGSAHYVGTPPEADISIPIRRGAEQIGEISITSAGAVSFVAGGASGVTFEPGQAIIIPRLDPIPAGLANCAFTLEGARS